VYTCENVTFQEGIDFAKQIEEHQDVDGIFAITDLVAVGVLSYFNDNKIKFLNKWH
jgi:LacI family transcriptional regulator